MIIVQDQEFYVNSDSLYDPSVEKLFLFEDPELEIQAKNISGMARMVKKEDIEEYLRENFGGAGYAVYGGGGRGGYGNTYGRGSGFGQGSNNGGPNLMYTYDIKPLNQLLQQPGTPQGDDRYLHVGSEIAGKVLGKNKDVEGKVISIETDEEGNVLHYIIIEPDTAQKLKIDPTSVTLITHEELPNGAMMDFVGAVGEQFYPSFKNYLKEDEGKPRSRGISLKAKCPHCGITARHVSGYIKRLEDVEELNFPFCTKKFKWDYEENKEKGKEV